MSVAAIAWGLVAGPALAFKPAPTTTYFTNVSDAAGVRYTPMLPATFTLCSELPVEGTAPVPADSIAAYCGYLAHAGGATVGDYDGDGAPDIYVLRPDQPALLYHNDGDGTFTEVAAREGVDLSAFVDFAAHQTVGGAIFADVDNDGDQDLYVLTQHTGGYLLFINQGAGAPGPRFVEEAAARGAAVPDATSPIRFGMGAAAGDFDRDGALDLFTTEWAIGDVPCGLTHSRLLRGLGVPGSDACPTSGTIGSFDDVTLRASALVVRGNTGGPYGFSPAFVDLDGDGWDDLPVVSDYETTKLFWNDGAGGFIDGTRAAGVGTETNGMGSAFGDYDNDGDLDWFVTAIYREGHPVFDGDRLYRNDGDRHFTDVTDEAGVRDDAWGWGAVFFDMDNDGDLDLVAANGFPGPDFDQTPNRLWENLGDGTFREVGALAGLDSTDEGRAVVVLDYDGDGDLDVFVAGFGVNAHGALYRNELNTPGAPPAADYLRVRVRGRVSNRDGRGATVRVTPTGGGVTQMRQIGAGSHYLGESERVAHFGLGAGFSAAARTVDVDVTFPSGLEVHERGVAPNQVLTVVEPDAPSLVAPACVPPPPEDCDADGVPDFCAPDCNGNGRPDGCDLAAGLDTDCDDNGVPDACDLAAFRLSDCNTNGEADLCEIQCHPALDADGDGVIDYCVTGCDEAGHCPGVDPDHPECVSAPDAGMPDAGMPDAGVDAGLPDAGAPDGGAASPDGGTR
ncbi:MAG: CRTAC1 family protein, partial [Myxococcales bacterium]|nr:CRTAC1 family protein [Myxococcales bacterium]